MTKTVRAVVSYGTVRKGSVFEYREDVHGPALRSGYLAVEQEVPDETASAGAGHGVDGGGGFAASADSGHAVSRGVRPRKGQVGVEGGPERPGGENSGA